LKTPSMVLFVAIAFALAGCGIETASTAATSATASKQALEKGNTALEQAKREADAAAQAMQQRADDIDKVK
jgi:hypothetical protein